MTDSYALIAATRNEGPFLVEWIAYHRAIGFTDILLFGDDDADGSTALLQALADGGAIEFHRNDGDGGRRNRACERAMRLPQVQQARYAMCLDVDEFLNIHTGNGTLNDLLDVTKYPDALSLCWRLFGQSGIIGFEDTSVIDRFTWAAPLHVPVSERQYGIKTLFKPSVATGTGPHRPTIIPSRTDRNTRWLNGSGRSVVSTLFKGGWRLAPSTAGYELAQINHYPIRSGAMFALHNFGHPPLGPEPAALTLSDFYSLNHNHERDATIRRMMPALRTETDRLMALPGVADAHARCVETTERLVRDVLSQNALNAQSPTAIIMDHPTAKRIMDTQRAEATDGAEPFTQSPLPADPVEGYVTIQETETAPAWLADLRRSEFRRGWYSSEETFAVQFTLRSRETLVVSFDNLSTCRDPSLARETWGYPFYMKEGLSHMGIMSFDRNWYRDNALFNFMEGKQRLFQQFKRVIFTGTSMGAYAATAFADLSPGSTVLAYSPQATLDSARVPWEERFSAGRKQDWSGRYAFAPDHCRNARDVFIVYDPYFEPDRLHAELYQGSNVHHLKSWYASHKSALYLRRADVLKDITREAIAGTLTSARYYKLFRSRRKLPWYLTGLADHTLDRNHPELATKLADYLQKSEWPGVANTIRKRMA